MEGEISIILKINESERHSVVSDFFRPHGLCSSWNSPGQNTGVGNHSLLQSIVPPRDLHGVAKSWTRLSDFTFTGELM